MLALILLACSGEAELEAPLLGDCPNCTGAPISGNGGGGFPDGGVDANDGSLE